MSQIGKIAGKTVKVYNPKFKGNEINLILFFKKFYRLQVLRAFSDIEKYKDDLEKVIHSEIVESVIRYCILKAIKHCSPVDTKKTFKFQDLLYTYDVAYDLKFKEIIKDDPSPEAALIVMAYEQFPSQEMIFLNLNRTFYIYQDLWGKYDNDNKINVINDIYDITGCNYKLAILLTYQILGNSKNFFFNLNSKTLDAFKNGFRGIYLHSDHKNYLKWISGKYGDYFNKEIYSILNKPVLKTNENPKSKLGKVYLLLSSYALLNKFSEGLYYNLAEKYAINDENLFKTIYGHVFERYVEELLKYYMESKSIKPEIKFNNSKHEQDKSCDFLVSNENTLLLVEVKQSSIFTNSKITGNEKYIADNIKNTLIKAAKQINKTYSAIKERKIEFKKYWDVEKTYGLIICGDHLYYANSIIKDILEKNIKVDILYDIINIDEIEILLDAQKEKETFVSIIEDKLLQKNNYDYKEYMEEIFPKKINSCEFLHNKAQEIQMMIEKLVEANSNRSRE